MPRLPERQLATVRAIEADLATVVDGGPPALARVTPELAALLQADLPLSIMYGPRDDGIDGVCVEQGFLGRPASGFLDALDAFIAKQRVSWTGFNPMSPEPDQRNTALDLGRVLHLIGARERREVPIARDFFPRVGLGSADNLRVLVCEGPSLLAWVGVFRDAPFGDVERRTLQRLVPALRRRLVIERLLAAGTSQQLLLDAALVAIPAAAFVTNAAGTPLEKNAVAQHWLSREGRAGRQAVVDAVRRGGDARFVVTAIVAAGAPTRYLVVARPGGQVRSVACVALASARWSLTPRQTDVLVLVVEGLTNRTIAASLHVAERTVEVHLTAIFEKAQVENRAELAAAAWRTGE